MIPELEAIGQSCAVTRYAIAAEQLVASTNSMLERHDPDEAGRNRFEHWVDEAADSRHVLAGYRTASHDLATKADLAEPTVASTPPSPTMGEIDPCDLVP